METFCTIITADHIHYALSLYDSLITQKPEVKLQVLVVDEFIEFDNTVNHGLTLHKISEVHTAYSGSIEKKYGHDIRSTFRWALKSVFLRYLLDSFEKVIFVDPDINFFGDFSFLFEKLDIHHVLLTPHWRVSDSRVFKNDLIRYYDHGIHNAGFVAVSNLAKSAMDWWSKVCLYSCEKNQKYGMWDDQHYLSIMHLFFDKVHILKHYGCNVAHWNFRFNRRHFQNGRLTFLGHDPLVFIHFDKDTVAFIKSGREKILEPYLKIYEERLKKFGMEVYG